MEEDDIVVNEAELEDGYEYVDNDEYQTVEGEGTPLPTSVEWHDYVMKEFTEDELQNDSPTLDGLRRVTEKLIGDIVESVVEIKQTPTPENGGRATAVVHLYIEKDDSKFLRVSDAADVYSGNTDAPFHKYPVATATSRAEARALRKALRLRKVISAEEQSVVAEVAEEPTVFEQSIINSTQIHLLNQAAKRFDVNLVKFINMGEKQYDSIQLIPFVVAKAMIERIQEYKDKPAPAAIKGYDPDWKANYGR